LILKRFSKQYTLDDNLETRYNINMSKQSNNKHSKTQRYKRYSYHCEGKLLLANHCVEFLVENVSVMGLKAHLHEQIELGHNYAIKVNVGILKNVEIIVKAVWDNNENTFGFEVMNNNDLWKKFIAQVEREKSEKKEFNFYQVA